jgi:alanyl-tRNA synthetase
LIGYIFIFHFSLPIITDLSVMTARLYYTDPALLDFTGIVTDVLEAGGRTAVVLDQTAFYPTSGGQPFDTGALGDARVEDVIDLDDGRIAHVVTAPLAVGARVDGRIDGPRRFDHMQQHTGQHVLSAAFDRVHHARTVSFHLGSDTSTIDLAATLSADEVSAAEEEANRIVWDDRPVRVRFVSEAEAAGLPLRKEPARGGTLRLVEVDGFDLSACGGTHVVSTGRIGIIAATGFERFKGGTRLGFVCGGRALARFRHQRDVLASAVGHLSVVPAELPGAIERLQDDIRAQKQVARALQQRLVRYEADAYAQRASDVAGLRLVTECAEGWDAQGLKALASEIAARPRHATVLLSSDSPPLIVIARAADLSLDAGAMLKRLTAHFGGKGGGRPELAQGGGLAGTHADILAAAAGLLGSP